MRSLRSLIEALARKGGQRIVLSVTTPAGFEFARREYPGLAVILSPLDLSFVVRRFIDRIRPRLVIFNELEVWPNWIALLHRRRVPMLLINGRISDYAFRRYRAFRLILRPFFRGIDGFLVQNEIYRQRFLRLHIPAEKITVCGNIKADEAANSVQALPRAGSSPLPSAPGRAGRGGSWSWPAATTRTKRYSSRPSPPWATAFFSSSSPATSSARRPSARSLRRRGIARHLFSQQQAADPGPQALVYDRMGYLFPIMSIADVVFMGGTCDPRTGGHNLYEPAALGKVIVGGPHYNNFPDIGRELEARGAYRRVCGSGEWREFLEGLAGLDLQKIGSTAREAVAGQQRIAGMQPANRFNDISPEPAVPEPALAGLQGGRSCQLQARSLRRRSFPAMFIISVDSLSFGGAGKTPLVMAIGEALQARGARFAVVSRGYRSRREKTGARVGTGHTCAEVGRRGADGQDPLPRPGSVHRPRPPALHRRRRRAGCPHHHP